MIAASIKEKEMGVVLRKIQEVPEAYDLIEIWINEIEDIIVKKLFEVSEKPLLAKITDTRDAALIWSIFNADFAYVDIDINLFKTSFIREMKDTKLIISYHDFLGTPIYADAFEIAKKIKSLGADIGKIIFTAQKIEDNLIPLRLLAEMKKEELPLISFCMGEKGRLSRIVSASFGNVINFVPPDSSWKTAAGQIEFGEWEDLRKKLKF